MINKVYENVKNFIKENYKFLIVYSIILSLFFIKLDYEVYSPGGLSNLNKRIEIEGAYEAKGSFNLTYVSAKKGSIAFVLLSYLIPSWDLVSLDDQRIENEDYEEILARGKIDLESVNENAIAVAFNEANLEYEVKKNDLTVYYVLDEAKTNLKVGDVIKKVNGEAVSSTDDLSKSLDKLNVGDTVKFEVLRNDKKLERTGIIYESEGKKVIGLYLTNVIKVVTDRNIEFNYNGNESGASGGIMSALQIYNSIVPEDITKGLKIAGTGTINLDGSVGEIAGVKYKLVGAVKKSADVFIVPTENYEEAIKIKEKEKYKIRIIEAKTFSQVLEELKNI